MEAVVTRIVHPELNQRTKWDWACIQDCFGGTRITPSDLDAIVERNGLYLIIETKLPGVPVPEGQRILLQTLSRLKQVPFVIIVWGRDPEVEEIEVLQYGGTYKRRAANTEDLRALVRYWWRRAEQRVQR